MPPAYWHSFLGSQAIFCAVKCWRSGNLNASYVINLHCTWCWLCQFIFLAIVPLKVNGVVCDLARNMTARPLRWQDIQWWFSQKCLQDFQSHTPCHFTQFYLYCPYDLLSPLPDIAYTHSIGESGRYWWLCPKQFGNRHNWISSESILLLCEVGRIV